MDHPFSFSAKRIFLAAVIVMVVPWRLQGAEPALLKDALLDLAKDHGRWAYTETSLWKTSKGRILDSTVIRIDPSKPYGEQRIPVVINGKPATERDRKKFRETGEKRARDREAGIVRPGQPSLGELVLIDQATVAAEDAQTVTYLVPLRKDNNLRFPPQKFRVLMRVDKASRSLVHISVNLIGTLREKLIVAAKSGDLEVDLSAPDPKHGKVITAIHGTISGSILFISMTAAGDTTLTDIKHVTPYDERLGTEIGPLKALDF